MGNSWDDMKRTKEEEFFERQNKAALSKIKGSSDQKGYTCPVDHESMKELVISGIKIARCQKCRGVWLDKQELERLLATDRNETQSGAGGWLQKFVQRLLESRE